MQYDGDIARAQKILADLPTFIPDAQPSTKYEVAGFFYWQGDKDRCKSTASMISCTFLRFSHQCLHFFQTTLLLHNDTSSTLFT
jgi:hypothetical protein